MSVFDAVRGIPTKTVAEFYGIEANRNGMAVCPFHPDRNPSMKLDRRFHCFGCQADGDAIDFTARYFALSKLEAAKKLAEDFGISYEEQGPFGGTVTVTPGHGPVIRVERFDTEREKWKLERKQREEDGQFTETLLRYMHLLREWKENFAPESPDGEMDPRYVTALLNIDWVTYVLDEMLSGTAKERESIRKNYQERVNAIGDIMQRDGTVAERDNNKHESADGNVA